MINFYLPDFFYFYCMNTKLVDILNEHPEYFKYQLKISAMYGCFPNQIWNGGRAVTGNFADVGNIIETIKTKDLTDEDKVEIYNKLISYKDSNLELFNEFNSWNNKLRN